MWRRRLIAHAVWHPLRRPGNHFLLRNRSDFVNRCERETKDFAYALRVDPEEALSEGLADLCEMAERFQAPDDLLRLQASSFLGGSA